MLEQTSLLAAVAATLLSAINDVVNDGDFKQKENPNVLNFLYIASFGAIIFNASATFTFLLLIDELGVLPTLASNLDRPNAGGLDIDGDILVYYGLGKRWIRTRLHCKCSLKFKDECYDDFLFIRDHLAGSRDMVPVSASHRIRIHYANNIRKSDDDLGDYFCTSTYVQDVAQAREGYQSRGRSSTYELHAGGVTTRALVEKTHWAHSCLHIILLMYAIFMIISRSRKDPNIH